MVQNVPPNYARPILRYVLNTEVVRVRVNQLFITPEFKPLTNAIAMNSKRPTDGFVVVPRVHEIATEYFVGVVHEHA
jgi:hypothetical protein